MTNPGAALVPASASTTSWPTRWIDIVRRAREAVVTPPGPARRDRLRQPHLRPAASPRRPRARAGRRRAARPALQRRARRRVPGHRPLQWDVFERAFAGRDLITVGDPKQAIYRFRGADVHAYLERGRAVRTAARPRHQPPLRPPRARRPRPTVRRRDARRPAHPVRARRSRARCAGHIARRDDGSPSPRPAVQVRIVPLDDRRCRPRRARSWRCRSCARSCSPISSRGRSSCSTTAPGSTDAQRRDPDGRRPVAPRRHRRARAVAPEANNVAEACAGPACRRCAPAPGRCCSPPAADAVAAAARRARQPHHAPTVRAAALGWFLSTDVADARHVRRRRCSPRCRSAPPISADRMRAVGVSAFYDEQKSSGGIARRSCSADEGGERELTDLDHIAELLAEAMHGTRAEPGRSLRVLDDLIADGDERAEAAMRRIDSDALAVQITTIHSAKGLEYPIVLVPFSFKPRANLSTPYSYIAPDGDARSTSHRRSRGTAALEPPGDESDTLQPGDAPPPRRRSTSRATSCACCTSPSPGPSTGSRCGGRRPSGRNTSALGRMLLDRIRRRTGAEHAVRRHCPRSPRRAASPSTSPPFHEPQPTIKAIAQIAMPSTDTATARSQPPISASRSQPPVWRRRATSATARAGRRRSTAAEPPSAIGAWQRWSFSRLGSDGRSRSPAARRSRRRRQRAGSSSRGGIDEPADAGRRGRRCSSRRDPTGAAAPSRPSGRSPTWPTSVGGTRFGTFVHGVLEHLDFTSPDLEADIRAAASPSRRGATGSTYPSTTIAAGLVGRDAHPTRPAVRRAGARRHRARATGSARAHLRHADRRRRPHVRPARSARSCSPPRTHRSGSVRSRRASPASSPDRHRRMDARLDRRVFRVPRTGRRRRRASLRRRRLQDQPAAQPGAADPVAAYHPAAAGPGDGALAATRCRRCCTASPSTATCAGGSASTYDPHEHLGGIGYLFVRGMVGPDTPVVRGVSPTACSRGVRRPPRCRARSPVHRECGSDEGHRRPAADGARRRGRRSAAWAQPGCSATAEVHGAEVLTRADPLADPLVHLAAAFALWAPLHGHACIDLDEVRAVVRNELARMRADQSDADRRRLDGCRSTWASPAVAALDEWWRPSSTPRSAASLPARRACRSSTHRPLVLAGTRALHPAPVGRRMHRGRHPCSPGPRRPPTGDPSRRRCDCSSELLPRVDALPTGYGAEPASTAAAGGRARPSAADGHRRRAGHRQDPHRRPLARGCRCRCRRRRGGRLRVALAAPTGKAASRMTEAIAAAVASTPAGSLPAEAIAQLCGAQRDHDPPPARQPPDADPLHPQRRQPLPHDVIVVDEASMVALPLMARLLEAVRPDARLVLVGDPDQLQSIEVGSVLADIVTRRDRATLTPPRARRSCASPDPGVKPRTHRSVRSPTRSARAGPATCWRCSVPGTATGPPVATC